MRFSVILVVLGFATVVGPIAAYVYQRQVHEDDVRGVDQLRARLDSLRGVLERAATAADSSTVLEQIRGREQGLTRREYHVPLRQTQLDRWWRVTSWATMSVGLGVIMVVVGVVGLYRSFGPSP